LSEVADQLAAELGEELPPLPEDGKAQLLQPPTPILRENNWPLLLVQKGFFEGAIEGEEPPEQEEEKGAWGEEAEMPETLEGDTGDVGEEVSGGREGLKARFGQKETSLVAVCFICMQALVRRQKASSAWGWVIADISQG
jgi:hypothetical protein